MPGSSSWDWAIGSLVYGHGSLSPRQGALVIKFGMEKKLKKKSVSMLAKILPTKIVPIEVFFLDSLVNFFSIFYTHTYSLNHTLKKIGLRVLTFLNKIAIFDQKRLHQSFPL